MTDSNQNKPTPEQEKIAAEEKAKKEAEEKAKKEAELKKVTDEKNKITAEKKELEDKIKKMQEEENLRAEAASVYTQYNDKRKRRFNLMWWIIVIIPTICTAIYYGVFAHEIYVSQSSFVVRTPQGTLNSMSQVGAILQSTGIGRAQDDSYTVQEFIKSHAALEALEKNIPVKSFYENKGDKLARFNGLGLNNSHEAFYKYFKNKVSINFDSISGVSTLYIRSFSAKDAQIINKNLLSLAENLINNLNQRAQKDTLSFAKLAVAEAEERMKETLQQLSEYRLENKIFDLPALSATQLSLISNLKSEIINIETQIEQLQSIAPDNPQIKALKTRQAKLENEFKEQSKNLVGNDNSIVMQSAEYQRLILANELASKELSAALAAYHNSKNELDRRQLYLEVINPPSSPDWAEEPRRIYNTMAVLLISMIIYGVLSLFISAIREHNN